MCNEYNGWTNRQSWLVGLWIDNDEPLLYAVTGAVPHLTIHAPDAPQVKSGIWTEAEYIRFKLADIIKVEIEDCNPLADQADLYSDLLGYALAMVDWQEVARHYIEEG